MVSEGYLLSIELYAKWNLVPSSFAVVLVAVTNTAVGYVAAMQPRQ